MTGVEKLQFCYIIKLDGCQADARGDTSMSGGRFTTSFRLRRIAIYVNKNLPIFCFLYAARAFCHVGRFREEVF